MELGLKGKVALVTGAGSQIGYGKGEALALAKEGCDLILADIDLEGTQKTAAEVEALGVKAIAVKVDIRNSDEVDEMVKAGLEKFGRIDILVNNAGRSRRNPVADTTEEDWHINIDINLRGTWNCIRAVIPQMLKRKSGKIINFTSGVARFGAPQNFLYAASKAGIIGMVRSLAVEVGVSGINVNGICPGLGDTGMLIDTNVSDEEKKALISGVPLGRFTTPQDIGNAVVFLASDAASDITGQTIQVDGGHYRL
jgi:3-oxoacyl-[acyl-carrier protein] reductase